MNQQSSSATYELERRPKLRRRLFIAILALVAGLSGLLIVGQTARGVVAVSNSAPGRLIDVGGYRLHLHCEGTSSEGKPTIVLEAGLGESSLTWSGIQPDLASTYRVCAYDRAGYGWSDIAPRPPSAAATVADLRTLLRAANEPGPYVLVAHSLGGLYARLFAHQYPDDVVGLALLDPSHEEMITQLPPDWQAHVRAAKAGGAEQLRVPALLADMGLTALIPQLAPADPRLPAEAQAKLRALGRSSGKSWRVLAHELATDEDILAEVRAARISNLGDLPLVVVKADSTAPTMPPEGLSPFTPARNLLQELAAQSSRGKLVTVPNSSHYVHYDAPKRVIEIINRLLEEVTVLHRMNHRSSSYLPARANSHALTHATMPVAAPECAVETRPSRA